MVRATDRVRFSGFQFAGLDFVDVTPHPGFARFDGADQGMPGGVKMFCGVFVFRGIATADVFAFQAEAKVHPGIAGLDAIFANMFFLGVGDFDLIQMRAILRHKFLKYICI
jgi:hypothetical protein